MSAELLRPAPDGTTVRRSAQYCTFWVADLFLGVDVLNVQEVLRHQEMTAVPRAPEVVQGLINLRGQIVTAIDLRRRLGLPDRDPDQLPINVVVHVVDEAISLLVDDVDDVIALDPSTREAVPSTLRADLRSLLTATYQLPGRLLLELNTAVAATPAL